MGAAHEAEQEIRIYSRVGWTLLGGLLLSVAVMAAGLLINAARGGGSSTVLPLDRELRHLADGDSAAVLDLGILLLFATPLAGVLVALMQFALEGDREFVLVAALLLILLVAAFGVALR